MLSTHMDNMSIRTLFWLKTLFETIYILKVAEFSVVACKIRVMITIRNVSE